MAEQILLRRRCRRGAEGNLSYATDDIWDTGAHLLYRFDGEVGQGNCEIFTYPTGALIDAWCEGTTRKEAYYTNSVPLVEIRETPNSALCERPHCGLRIDAVNLTNTEEAGSSTTATVITSGYSQTIQFSLNGFIDNQTSNVFEGLSIGSYIAYARAAQDVGCVYTFPFEVKPVRKARFHLPFKDTDERQHDLYWMDRAYTGEPYELLGFVDVARINTPSVGNKVDAVSGSSLDLGILIRTYEDQLPKEFLTADERKYRVDHFIDGQLNWQGYVLPDILNMPHLYPPYTVSQFATDGLGTLKDIPYLEDNGLRLYGRASAFDILVRILGKLDLELPFYTAVNVFEDRMDPEEEPLKQEYFDQASFYSEGGEPDSCEQVLTSILQPFMGYIRWSAGAFHVLSRPQQANPYHRRKYSIKGELLEQQAYDETRYVRKDTAVRYVNAAQQVDNRQGYKRASVKLQYGKPENLIINGDFEEWGDGLPLGWTGNAPITKRLNKELNGFKVELQPTDFIENARYIETAPVPLENAQFLQVEFDYESGYDIISGEKPLLALQLRVGAYYLQQPNANDINPLWQWVTTPQTVYIEPLEVQGTIGLGGTAKLPVYGFHHTSPLMTGDMVLRIYEPLDPYFTSLLQLDNVRVTQWTPYAIEGEIVTGENEPYSTAKPYTLDLSHGSGEGRCENIVTLAGSLPSYYWMGGMRLQEWTLRNILQQHPPHFLILRADVKGPVTPITVLRDDYYPAKRFAVDGINTDLRTGISSVECVELFGGVDAPPPPNAMLYEDGTAMLYEDYTYMLYE